MRNQRRPISDHYGTVWKVLDSLESFASGKFEEGLRQAAESVSEPISSAS